MFSKTGHLALGPIKDLLLDMAEAREADALPSLVLRRLVDHSEGLLLGGVWLLEPKSAAEWLDLAATAGTIPVDPGVEETIRRVPSTSFDIGRLVAAADPVVVPKSSFDMPSGISDWAERLGIAAFWGQRVAWRGTTFGVIGAFATVTPTRSDDDILRLVASQLGAAIARERASRELRELRERLATHAEPVQPPSSKAVLSEQDVRRFERENIVAALEATRGRIYGRGGAAELLGLKPTTLASRLKKLGISARP
jgi:transcriptional regulator with GAF, ATPase, and Fis domain